MKPKFEVGQIVKMKYFVAPNLLEGELIAIVQIKKATYSIRCQVKKSDQQLLWVDRDALCLPLGVL